MQQRQIKNQDYFHSDSEDNCFNCLQLSSNHQRLPAEKILKRKMKGKQAVKEKKSDENLKIHKKRNNIKQYQINKSNLETPPTQDKIFQEEEQNDNGDSLSLQSVQFADFDPKNSTLSNNIQNNQEQALKKYQENINLKNHRSSSNQQTLIKKSKKQSTKNLLQFFWNKLKNRLESFQEKEELTEFSQWFSQNKSQTPSMDLITQLYRLTEIKDFLTQLFETKFFYRALMLSSAQSKNKKFFVRYLRRLQRSFFKRKLDHIH